MSLNYIQGKCKGEGEYKFTKSQEKISQLMYLENNKVFANKEKELKTLIQTIKIYNQDIGIEFGTEKCTVFILKSGKREAMERTELPNQESIHMW